MLNASSINMAVMINEQLHDGVEFTLKEVRDDWALVELADGRECWLPLSQAQLIR